MAKVMIFGDRGIGSSIAHYPKVAAHATDAVPDESDEPLDLSRLACSRILDNAPLRYEVPRAP